MKRSCSDLGSFYQRWKPSFARKGRVVSAINAAKVPFATVYQVLWDQERYGCFATKEQAEIKLRECRHACGPQSIEWRMP